MFYKKDGSQGGLCWTMALFHTMIHKMTCAKAVKAVLRCQYVKLKVRVSYILSEKSSFYPYKNIN